MSRSSVLQPLGGPLAGRSFEFPGHDVVVGSAPDCEVRVDAPGVHPYHARIVISETGVTLFGIEGVVGINDDKVLGEGRLNSGDFVWLGEPGAEGALMFQFTLGSEGFGGGSGEPEVVHEMMEEFEPQDIAFDAGEPAPELELLDIQPESAPLASLPLPDAYAAPEPAPASVLPPPRSTSSSGAFKPPAPWQTAAPVPEAPAEVEYASAWESKPVAPPPDPVEQVEEVIEEVEAPEPDPAPAPPPPTPVARPAGPPQAPPRRQNTSPNLRAKAKPAPEVDLAALLPPHPVRPARTTSSTGTIVGGLITLVLLGVGISWVVSSTPPVDAPPSVPGSVVMPKPRPATPANDAAPATGAAPLTGAGLVQQAAAAVAAGDVAKAGQLLDQALALEPANAEASARKAEIAPRLAILARMFSPGPTQLSGKHPPRAVDPAARVDLAAQIRCGVTPASVEPGAAYTVRCSILNSGQKPFRLESVSAVEVADGARSPIAGTAPPQDLAPQGEAMILEKTGTWAARARWSLDVTAKTTSGEAFTVNHSWR